MWLTNSNQSLHTNLDTNALLPLRQYCTFNLLTLQQLQLLTHHSTIVTAITTRLYCTTDNNTAVKIHWQYIRIEPDTIMICIKSVPLYHQCYQTHPTFYLHNDVLKLKVYLFKNKSRGKRDLVVNVMSYHVGGKHIGR